MYDPQGQEQRKVKALVVGDSMLTETSRQELSKKQILAFFGTSEKI